MQKKRSNSLIKITDLSPNLVSEMFNYIENLIKNHHLDVPYFEKTYSTLHPGQKYFIDFYLKDYLNYFSASSYISNYLENQKKFIKNDPNQDSSTQSDFSSLKNLIKSNSIKILEICGRNESINEKMFRVLLNSDQTLSPNFDFNIYLEIRSIIKHVKLPFDTKAEKDVRIPIYNGVEKPFMQAYSAIFSSLLDDSYRKKLLLNTFQFIIDQYINWYNTKRIHASLGYLTPLEKEIELTTKNYKNEA